MPQSEPNPRRILIVQTAFIGDVILVTPLIRAVSELYPNAQIDAMTVPGAAPLLANNPHLNKVIVFDKKHSRFSLFKLARTLRSNRYDLAISPHSSFTTHLLLRLSGAGMRIGYARGFLSRLLMTHQVPHPKGIHKIRKNLSLLKLLTNKDFAMDTELFPSREDTKLATELLRGLGDASQPLIAIAPGSIWATKCWSLEAYKTLALELAMKGYRIVLVGSLDDAAKCDSIMQYVKESLPSAAIVTTAGKSGLLASAEILRLAQLLICNDSGALHIANAVKTRVFAFFGPTVRSIGYYPYREGDHVFEVELQCRPCGSHGPQRCPLGHHNCMRLIEPVQVVDMVTATLPLEDFHA